MPLISPNAPPWLRDREKECTDTEIVRQTLKQKETRHVAAVTLLCLIGLI